MSSDPKGPETIPLTAEADEHEGHYAWEVEPFDPEGPVGIVISMADVECGQPLDATLVVLADSDDEREVEWARSTADDIAARLNEHQAQAATIAELQREIGGYRQALENCLHRIGNMPWDQTATCDWGSCDGETFHWRFSPELKRWLGVCERHSEDYQPRWRKMLFPKRFGRGERTSRPR